MIKQHVKKIQRRHIREIVVYGMVGITALVVQDLIYWAAHHYYGVFPSVAMILGNIGGMFIAYVGHIKFTFKKERYSKREFVKFVITSGIGLLINVGGVRFITKVLLLSPVWGLAPTLVTPFITFLISKFWAFRVKKPVVKALHK
jgi:putative flippase GtrA